jgi:hypothetical protein
MSRTKNARATIVAVRDEILNEQARLDQEVAADRITRHGAQDQLTRRAIQLNWGGRLRAAETSVNAYADSAQASVATARQKLSQPDPGNAPGVFELYAARIWDRHRRLLDSLEPVAASFRAQSLLETASGDERAVLLQELGAYLESRDPDSVDQFERAVPAALASDPEYAAATEYATHANNVAGTLLTQLQHVDAILDWKANPPEHRDASHSRPLAADDPDLLRFLMKDDPTETPAPIVPGTTSTGSSTWDPHEQDWRPNSLDDHRLQTTPAEEAADAAGDTDEAIEAIIAGFRAAAQAATQ